MVKGTPRARGLLRRSWRRCLRLPPARPVRAARRPLRRRATWSHEAWSHEAWSHEAWSHEAWSHEAWSHEARGFRRQEGGAAPAPPARDPSPPLPAPAELAQAARRRCTLTFGRKNKLRANPAPPLSQTDSPHNPQGGGAKTCRSIARTSTESGRPAGSAACAPTRASARRRAALRSRGAHGGLCRARRCSVK